MLENNKTNNKNKNDNVSQKNNTAQQQQLTLSSTSLSYILQKNANEMVR
jgi:hypothetical protein